MTSLVSEIHWHRTADKMPDERQTVLIFIANFVDVAAYERGHFCQPESGNRILGRPEFWASMPEGPR